MRATSWSRAAGIAALGLVACSLEEPGRLRTTRPAPAATGRIEIAPRRPLIPNYPCSRCHAGRPANATERRLVEFHTQKVLHHGPGHGWCYRCHAKNDLDQLRLSDGTLVGFDEAYELCGSCHGDKLRDFRTGIHGLTTGEWNGNQVRRSCTYCHDPHSPVFPPMTPERAPSPPRGAPAESPPTQEHANVDER